MKEIFLFATSKGVTNKISLLASLPIVKKPILHFAKLFNRKVFKIEAVGLSLRNTLISSRDSDGCVVLVIKGQKAKGNFGSKIKEMFEQTWKAYPRKVAKAQAFVTYKRKMEAFTKEERIMELARKIYRQLMKDITLWKTERNGEGRPLEFVPYFSTWLNCNF